ncbi:Elongator complex protein 5 [Psilocybe cubensis]|uniref:Elongator complex protein 5 n=2 Tax=Psilocybe cubensis TaxID=181762 RepID=A0A8H7Y5Q2_PSICU|nr:Elongator complex protein 5 [Psilocybe cubensis]KAH9486887.1 Elongator complex protein 5 [Psilocybe cubensis]
MSLFSSILNDEAHRHPLLIVQSSLAQSGLPVLRSILTNNVGAKGKQIDRENLLFCLLYPPSSLVDEKTTTSLNVYDWTDRVSGYNEADLQTELLAIVTKAVESHSGPINIIVDSVDTLLEDIGSVSETYRSLSKLYAVAKVHSDIRIILHSQSPSPLLPLITQTTFSPSLSHAIVHPPALIAHLTTEFLLPPPPISPLPKFWSVFIPVSERVHDTERIVFGPAGQGSGSTLELVVELIVREGAGRKRGVERVLEGWSLALGGPCALSDLESIMDLTKKQKEHAQPTAPDPTQNLPFNLSLTSSQQESRAKVPLPYAHEGKPMTSSAPAAIFYDPDSADDIDDDDPDEDLDI